MGVTVDRQLWRKLFLNLLMIKMKLCMSFGVGGLEEEGGGCPQGMANYVKKALFPPYHSEKAHGEKVLGRNRHSCMEPSLSRVEKERLV